MTPFEIQFELKKRGITQCSIAKEIGVSAMVISLVIFRETISDRIMKAIARKIARDHNAVFPYYYSREKISETRRKRPVQVY